ncbi:25199_t:CDS:1, partial [Dentiscutata erythropus]
TSTKDPSFYASLRSSSITSNDLATINSNQEINYQDKNLSLNELVVEDIVA